jgi:hypothetical protein
MKTAVEWLQELYDNRPAYEEFILDEEFEQAKQMEKEQIIDAYYGKIDGVYGYREAGEEYYNQTFNQK